MRSQPVTWALCQSAFHNSRRESLESGRQPVPPVVKRPPARAASGQRALSNVMVLDTIRRIRVTLTPRVMKSSPSDPMARLHPQPVRVCPAPPSPQDQLSVLPPHLCLDPARKNGEPGVGGGASSMSTSFRIGHSSRKAASPLSYPARPTSRPRPPTPRHPRPPLGHGAPYGPQSRRSHPWPL